MVWKREHADETGTQRMNGRKGGREGRIVWEALPKCKASQRHAPAAGLLHRRVAHIHGTTALTMVSDRTAPPALPCPSSAAALVLHVLVFTTNPHGLALALLL